MATALEGRQCVSVTIPEQHAVLANWAEASSADRRDERHLNPGVSDRDYVKATETQDLDALCQTLQELHCQCEPGMHVYCIIGSVTLFKRAPWFGELQTVLRYLKESVQDGEMPAIFKVMLTSPVLLMPELENLAKAGNGDRDNAVYLSADNAFMGGELWEDDMEDQLA